MIIYKVYVPWGSDAGPQLVEAETIKAGKTYVTIPRVEAWGWRSQQRQDSVDLLPEYAWHRFLARVREARKDALENVNRAEHHIGAAEYALRELGVEP
jgi:hypothetical protein